VCSINQDSAHDALLKSQVGIRFPSVKFLSHKQPKNLNQLTEFIKIDELRLRSPGVDDYSHFMIYDLWRFVETEFCLIVQADGYVINPQSWNDIFLEYDYIGAPWPLQNSAYIDPFGKQQRVGNGGFSLRSRKLLEVPRYHSVPWDVANDSTYQTFESGTLNEDGNICVHNRHIFEKAGCKFAPVEIAVQFSQELPIPESKGVQPFGFHRYKPKAKRTLSWPKLGKQSK
jgi:hypothetical protein